MSLGLGTSLSKSGLITPGIVTDSLVLKQNYATGSVVPVSDGAALFDGVDDYIDISSAYTDIHGEGDLTICCWVYVDPDCAANARIWSTADDGSNDQNFLMINTTAGQFRFEAETSSAAGEGVNGIDGDGLWTHCACVYNDTTNLIYLYNNGILQGTTSLGGTIEAKDFIVGARNDTPDNEFKGYICNVGIWSAALTQAQIKSIMWKNYAGLISSETTSLVSWWNLSADANDNHGSNNGTLS